MSLKYVLKPALTLFLTSAVVITALSVANNLTTEPIERQKRKTQEAAMREVLPASEYRELKVEKTGSIVAVYEGRQSETDGNQLAGYVIQLSPEGYSGNIDLLTGISVPDEKISGMRVLRHSETPGLGALAVKENFYQRYDNRDLIPLGVARSSPGENDIAAITSATITTRAITNAVNEAIEWYLTTARQGLVFNQTDGDGGR